jgi:hypothetical protein
MDGSLAPGRLLAGGDHGGAAGLALGDAAVGPLRQQFVQRLLEDLLVE